MNEIHGILIFGANGCGKTTLGRALAARLGYCHIDAEDYYFPPQDIPYTVSRPKDEVIKLMLDDIEKYSNFVLTSVTGDYGEEIIARYDLAVCLTVPREIQLDRIRNRATEKYGERVMPGGDMYEINERFIKFAANRPLEVIDEFAKKLTCQVVYMDGTSPMQTLLEAMTEIILIGVTP